MHRTLRFSAATITFLALGPSSWVHGGGKPGKMVVAGLVLATAAGISAASPEAALAVTEPQLLHGVRTWQSDLVRIQERAAPCRLGPAPECPSTLLFAADVDLSAFNAVLTSKVKALREKLVKVDPVTDENPFAVGHPIPEPDPCPDTPHAPTDFHAYMDWEADQAIRLAEIQTLRILSACTGEGGAPEALTASQAQGLVTSLSTLNHLDGVLSQMKVNEYGYQLARTQTKLIATQIGLDLSRTAKAHARLHGSKNSRS